MEHNFSMKQKILNLCCRCHILRNYRFAAEVTFIKLDWKTGVLCYIDAPYKALYGLQHKATHTNYSTNCNTAQQKKCPKPQFSNFVIKQHGNSKKFR